MTETTDKKELTSPIERFILYWGDMGGVWGVSRSVSQIHALLYVSEGPLTAEEIAGTLGLARSNVSTSLKELLAWDLIRRVPMKGDRRDHFEAEADVWEMVSRIAAGRKQRELDPALAALRRCVVEAKEDARVPSGTVGRLEAMLDFTEQVDRWYAQILSVPRPKLAAVIRMGARVVEFLPIGKAR